MQTTNKFSLTTYNSSEAKGLSNKEWFDSYESNFNLLDSKACGIVVISLTSSENGSYTTTTKWKDIKKGIEDKSLLVVDVNGTILPLMVCNKSGDDYNLLFGYANVLTDSIITRAISCSYIGADESMNWSDYDGEIEVGPQVPKITTQDEGKILIVKNGIVTFADITQLVKSELIVEDDGKCRIVYHE